MDALARRRRNLIAEGIPAERITRVGNIMLDSFEMRRAGDRRGRRCPSARPRRRRYGVVTLHRPSNVDDPAQLSRLAAGLIEVQHRLPVVFPVHPRTAARLAETGLAGSSRRPASA